MNAPSCKRRFRKCGEFGFCVNIGEKGYVLAESSEIFQTAFLYVVKGVGKMGKMFKSDFIEISEGNFYDIQNFEGEDVIFKSFDDFYLIGFNPLDSKWKARLIRSDETELDLKSIYDKPQSVSSKSFIVCLDGNPIINDKKLRRYDYSEVTYPKQYNIQLNEGVLGFFTKTL